MATDVQLGTIAINQLTLHELIGIGGQGSVYKGEWKRSNNGREETQKVAVKKLLRSSTKTDCSEFKTLSGLRHPNIINVFGLVKEIHDLWIVMELCKYSLRDYFKENPSPLLEDHLLRWSLEASLPLEYLRQHNILHRDIKPENYVIDDNHVLKLTDFGVARELQGTVSKFTEVGTLGWMAPEIHLGKEDDIDRLALSPSYDIFSLGLLLWYLVARRLPYSEYESNYFAITNAIVKGKRPTIPDECPAKLAELIKRCWSGDRKERPPISEIIHILKSMIPNLGSALNLPNLLVRMLFCKIKFIQWLNVHKSIILRSKRNYNILWLNFTLDDIELNRSNITGQFSH